MVDRGAVGLLDIVLSVRLRECVASKAGNLNEAEVFYGCFDLKHRCTVLHMRAFDI